MKLIIDIPDNQYNQICELRLHNRTIFDDAIRNGIPLDKIRAEIEQKYEKYKYLFDTDYMGTKDLEWVLSVIDKYRKE